MRFPPLLLLLITTQCFILATSDDATTPGEEVDRASDPSEYSLSTKDDLGVLTDDDLKNKFEYAEKKKNEENNKKNSTETALTTKRGEFETAKNTVTAAEQRLNTANSELEKLLEPRKQMKEDAENKNSFLDEANDKLRTATNKANFPEGTTDKTAYCKQKMEQSSGIASEGKGILAEFNATISALNSAKTNAKNARAEKKGKVTIALRELTNAGCKESTIPSDRSKRDTCTEKNTALRTAKEALRLAEAAEDKAADDLTKAKDARDAKEREVKSMEDEVANLQAFLDAQRAHETAAAEYDTARKLYENEPDNIVDAKAEKQNAETALTQANSRKETLDGEVKKLETELESAKARSTKADAIYDHYKDAYDKIKQKDDSSSPVPIVAGVGVGAMALVIIGAIVFFIIRNKKKKNKKANEKGETPDDNKKKSKSGKKENKSQEVKDDTKGENGEKSKSEEKESKNEEVKDDTKLPEKKEEAPVNKEDEKVPVKKEDEKVPEKKEDEKVPVKKEEGKEKKPEEEKKWKPISYKLPPNDARVIDENGKVTVSVDNFQYGRIIQFDAYDGDLSHDKANEVVKKVPTSYMCSKDRMKFFFYGLEEDKRREATKKPDAVASTASQNSLPSDFFQSAYLKDVSEEHICSWIKSINLFHVEKVDGKIVDKNKNEPRVFSPEQYITRVTTWLEQNPPTDAKFSAKRDVKLDAAGVRGEFLQYLHKLAAAPIDDKDIKSRFPFEVPHVMWIVSNAKKVLAEHHPSQLMKFNGSIVIVADIHGQFPDLMRMFAQRATEEKPGWLTHNYIFLGDYVDRGKYSMEVCIFLFLLKILYPKNIFLLRGNHEDLICNYIYGFHEEVKQRYKKCTIGEMNIVWRVINEVFNHLPIAALINGNILCMHGGIPHRMTQPTNKTLEELFSEVPMPYVEELATGGFSENFVAEMVWNDPDVTVEGFADNTTRGVCSRFGPSEFEKLKKQHGIVLFFRGDQMLANGYDFSFQDPDFFSAFGAPNYGGITLKNRAATFDIDIDGKIGCQIAGRYSSIQTSEKAMEAFRKYHVSNKAMDGVEIEDDVTTKVTKH